MGCFITAEIRKTVVILGVAMGGNIFPALSSLYQGFLSSPFPMDFKPFCIWISFQNNPDRAVVRPQNILKNKSIFHARHE